ncbi:MAG: hypothetical protein Q8N47_15110 [Bryobacterales bacterium]|nr:hypothetical protein [Bryobacterales bacterium]
MNYTLFDASHIALAIALLPVILMLPGYPFARLVDFAQFRRRPLWQKSLLCLPVSVGIMPVLCYLAGRALTMRGALALLVALCAAGSALMWKDLARARSRRGAAAGKLRRPVLVFLLVCSALVILSLSDLQIGSRLYPSTVAFDLSFRSIITGEFARTDIVPGNPLFADGQPVGLRYDYYWFLYCGLLERLTGGWLAARYILSACAVWMAAGVWVLLVLFIRYVCCRGPGRGRRSLLALALLCVGGLDILPVSVKLLMGVLTGNDYLLMPEATMEWWNGQQITMWVNQFLWVPNHVASLIACFTALLLLLPSSCVPERKRWPAAVLGGVCLASSVGLSVYVAIAFFAFLGLLGVVTLLGRQWRQTAFLAAGGGVATALGIPFALELLVVGGAAGGSGSGSAGPFAFCIRPFGFWHFLAETLLSNPERWLTTGDLLFLPVQYFLELGFFFAVLILRLRKIKRGGWKLSTFDSIALMMLATTFTIGSFLRSVAPHGANDLGWRCFMMTQFVLVLWGAELLSGISPRFWPMVQKLWRGQGTSAILAILLALGLTTSAAELTVLRTFVPRLEWKVEADPRLAPKAAYYCPWLGPVQNLGGRAHDLREAYEWLGARLPPNARVQFALGDRNDWLFHCLYSRRAAVFYGEGAATFMGVSAQRAKAVQAELDKVFGTHAEPDAGAACGRLGVAAWIVEDIDAVWRDPTSWVWRTPAQFRNKRVAVFLCGSAGR